MQPEKSHVPDHELLQLADGELSSWRSAEVNKHVTNCPVCRKRMSEIEATLADFIRLHGVRKLSSPDGPAALLKATLSTTHREQRTLGRLAVCAALLIIVAAAALFTEKQWTVVEASSVPRTDLTPGAVTAITKGEACRGEASQSSRDVPIALQQAVFREYGIAHPGPSAYEVDYLITPELGGANDIRNLWPQPYFTKVWNARVKDALENRLHQMVCSGQLDLGTAQHDISANWIGAYKKYFRTDRPLPLVR